MHSPRQMFPGIAAVTATWLALSAFSCASPTAVRQFAAESAATSDLLPRVSAVQFQACVQQHVLQQMQNAPAAMSGKLVDRAAAEKQCENSRQTGDRLKKEYAVIFTYLRLLSDVANGKVAGFEESVKGTATQAASLAGASAPQAAAAAGLASAIAALYLHHRSAQAVARAMDSADPHMQALCAGFRTDIARFILKTLENEEDELNVTYADARPADGLRILLSRQYDADLRAIQSDRAAVTQFASALQAIADGHAALVKRRHQLGTRDSIQEMYQYASRIHENVTAVRTAWGI